MNKILITGGAGFIGSHLIEELVKDKNNEVISIDNYFLGSIDNHIEGAEYIEGHTKNIEKLIDKPDIIYHLGEYSRVLTSFEDIDMVWDMNKVGTFAVLEYCRKNNIRLIYAGSSTKFGEFSNINKSGTDQSPYAYFKSTNTDLVNNYGLWFGLNYAITYFYNVFGGREVSGGKYAGVLPVFQNQWKNGEKITINGTGEQRRAFTHIDDTIKGLMLVGEKGFGDGHCIGTEKSYSIIEIAEMFGGEIEKLSYKKGDRKHSKLDLTEMNRLGWSANLDVKDFISEFKNKNKNENNK